jgi:hypothetical protein
MEQDPSWEANSHSASQEIPHLLWNPKVHYHAQNTPPLVPILSHMHPVHILPSCFPKIHSHVIFPSIPRSSEGLFPSGFPTDSFYSFSSVSWGLNFMQCAYEVKVTRWTDRDQNEIHPTALSADPKKYQIYGILLNSFGLKHVDGQTRILHNAFI